MVSKRLNNKIKCLTQQHQYIYNIYNIISRARKHNLDNIDPSFMEQVHHSTAMAIQAQLSRRYLPQGWGGDRDRVINWNPRDAVEATMTGLKILETNILLHQTQSTERDKHQNSARTCNENVSAWWNGTITPDRGVVLHFIISGRIRNCDNINKLFHLRWNGEIGWKWKT